MSHFNPIVRPSISSLGYEYPKVDQAVVGGCWEHVEGEFGVRLFPLSIRLAFSHLQGLFQPLALL